MATLDDHPVVRLNRDTLYSFAVTFVRVAIDAQERSEWADAPARSLVVHMRAGSRPSGTRRR